MNLPRVSINMAMTLDGKVVRPDGKWYGLSSRADKRRMDEIRAESDALILGKNSLLNDDPVTHIRYVPDAIEPRPILLVRSGSLPTDRKVFVHSKKKPLLFCTEKNEEQVRAELSDLAEIRTAGKEDILIEKILSELYDQGHRNVLLEGGPRLNDSFLRTNLVQRLYLTIVPFLIGQSDLPSITDGKSAFTNFDSSRWRLASCESKEDEIFLIYEKHSL